VRLAVVLNSACDGTRDIAERITQAAQRAAIDVRTDICDGASLAAATQRALDLGSTTVAAGGGDGTMSTVASVLAGTHATLGILPLGTLNHFARDLGVPMEIDRAIATILADRVVPIDVGEVNGRIFINNSSVGLYPRLVLERERRQRQGRRKLFALAAAAWTVWRRYRRITVVLQQERGEATRVRTPFVFVGNNVYQLSGLDFGSRVRLDGGRLHLCMAPELSALGVVRVLGGVLVGRLGQVKQFESLERTGLTIDAWRPRLRIALDGEVTTLRSPLRYRIRPGALRVAIPPAGD
jgi:diacylglycerol kinase family enzyme